MVFSKRASISILTLAVSFLAIAPIVSASVFLGGGTKQLHSSCTVTNHFRRQTSEAENHRQMIARTIRRNINPTVNGAAMAIPGYGVAEQVFVGGFANFLSIYNIVITARILLSWFPQTQSIGVLQPVFQITDPYLNAFRGLIPPIFGLDLSPILAFVLLNVMTNVTAAVGAEITPDVRKKLQKSYSPFPVNKPRYKNMQLKTTAFVTSVRDNCQT